MKNKKTPARKMTKVQNEVSAFDVVKRKIIFSIVLLGIFSILAGVGLIVAAHWAVIPPIIKVSVGLAVLAASLVTTLHFQRNEKPLWMEAFLFVSFLLVGGNIALIQQSYGLKLSWQMGSFWWWALSLPLVFFTKYKLIPLCSLGLLGFSIWDIVWDMNYMLRVGWLFIFMMLTHFFDNKMAKFLRDIAFILAIFFLFVGDISSNTGAGIAGVIGTTIFLIFALTVPKTEDGMVKYYNYLFLLVAWRIFLLFWGAYFDLTRIGISLIVFGTILLGGAGLYTYYYKQIQEFIRGFIRHE